MLPGLTFVALKFITMATQTVDTKKYWLFFLVSFVIFVLMLMFMNQWFWASMPFMLTYLVLAMDVI